MCKNIGIRIYFGSATAEYVRFSFHSEKYPDLPLFLLLLGTASFEVHLLSPLKSGNFGYLKVTRFLWNSPIPFGLQPGAIDKD